MGYKMPERNHLKRLPRGFYQNDAIVHWTITIRDRKLDWLSPVFLYRFRELQTHTLFRYGLACPIFCLMPDHMHFVWMGLVDGSDQLNAMKHFRPRCDDSLGQIGISLQDQSYDHVLTAEERREVAFHQLCEYIARNPERAGLEDPDCCKEYPYTGCLIPGYPELQPFEQNFRDQLDRTVSHIRKSGFQQIAQTP